MRKLLFVLAVLLSGIYVSFAGVVPQERAASVAESFFKADASTKSSAKAAVRLVASYPEVMTKAGSQAPALYVFERETGGFVLVSGDDVARPVLGYSLSGSFRTDEPLPVNFRDMLDWYAAEIKLAREKGWEPSPSVRGEWNNPTKAGSSGRVQLTTAAWNQFAPYNNLCPKVDGEECPCGCVATAMAIIMRYHKWPDHGTGTLPGYDFYWDGTKYRYHIDGHDLGVAYDWDSLPLSGSFSQASGAKVAQLCYDLGVMSQMDYSPEGSGALGDSPILLPQYFGYDKSMRYYNRLDFSDDRWEELIRDEIDACRPVFHCGNSNEGGHAFVLDGYNEDRYFSINYGWGGAMNAFYTMTPIEGHEDELTEFNRWQDMVCHIMPDKGCSPFVNAAMLEDRASFGWDFRSQSFRTGQFTLDTYRSTGYGPVELCFCLYDDKGELVETLSEPFTVESGPEPFKVPSVECKAPSRIADGFRIMLSRRDEKREWVPLPQERYSYNQFDGKRKLSEMVSLGHTFGTPNKWNGQSRCLFLRGYKDIYWEIRRTRDDKLIVNSGADPEKVSFFRAERLYQGHDGDAAYFEFMGLEPGEYKLILRNFDEEMTLWIEL